MAKRKTVAVKDLLDRVNHMLEASVPEVTEGRKALASLIESVLMDTGNYRGFGYLDAEWDRSGNLIEGDPTRVMYYG